MDRNLGCIMVDDWEITVANLENYLANKYTVILVRDGNVKVGKSL